MHVLDASRVVGVVSDLLDPDRAEALDAANRAEQERLREQHANRAAAPLLTAGAGAGQPRAWSTSPTCPCPRSPACGRSAPTLTELRAMIDWQFLFLAWELKGKYPAILDQPVARELFDDAQRAAGRDRRRPVRCRPAGSYGFWPAHVRGRRHRGRSTGVRFPMLRQQTAKPAEPAQPVAWPTTWRRPATTSAGSRSPIHGAEELAAAYEAEQRRLPRRSWSRRWPTGWPRRSPSTCTCRPAGTGSSRTPSPTLADLHAERFRGIRPALGYPASPDHSLKRELFDLLGAEALGHRADRVVRDDAGGRVSGLIFAHPAVAVLHRRPARPRPGPRTTPAGAACPLAEVERWLRPNLDYDPA